MKNFTRIFSLVFAMLFMVSTLSAQTGQKTQFVSQTGYETGSHLNQRSVDDILFTFDFESDEQGWTIGNTFPTPVTWSWGNDASLSSAYFDFAGNATNFIGINADAAGSDGVATTDWAISPVFDFSAATQIEINLDYLVDPYGGILELHYRINGGAWVLISGLPGGWTNTTVSLTTAAYVANVELGFYFDEVWTWGYGAAFDNVVINDITTGAVDGFVLNGAGQTIGGAEIWADGRYFATTDGTGYYMAVDVPSGDTDVTAMKAGYNDVTITVAVVVGSTVSQDFVLTAPNLTLTPLIFDETLHPNEYLTTYLSLLNTGDGPLDFTAAVVYPADPPLTLPNVQNQPVEGTRDHSLGAIPAGIQPSGETPIPVFLNNGTRDGDNIAWIASPQGGVASILYTMDMGTYATTTVGPSGVDPSSGDFMNGDATTMYTSTTWGDNLSSVDVATGASTLIGAFSGAPGMGVNGMACDRTSNTMYVAMTDDFLTSSQIGTVDVTTGVITPIGTPNTVAPGLIDIAIDGTGQMYGWCLVTDASYLIDKTTGAVGTLGSLGFDANYGQGGNWNADDDVIYLTAFNLTAFQGQLRALDRITGGTTMLTVLPELQMTAFGVPNSGGGGGASGWLTLSDYSGSVAPAGGTFNIGVNFSAAGTVAGEVYHADIVVGSDPFVGQVTIPVTMTIAGDPLPEITGFTAELTDPVIGEATLMWDAFREVTFEYYLIKRNGEVVATTDVPFYVDLLPAFGSYDYTVQPVYLEGEGPLAGPETVEWFEPALCWSPASPENTQWTETQQPVMLELENCNNGVLEFTFPDYAARALLSDPDVIKNEATPNFRAPDVGDEIKGNDDEFNGQGNPIILGAGGPDGFGYVWIDSDEAGGPIYNWIDISGTGTLVTGFGDDNIVGPFPLSFDFPFYGEDKSEFWINSNGTIGFTSAYITLGNVAIPTTNSNKDFIAWFWDDLDPAGPNTSVYYEDFGNYLVIQFDHYNEYPDGNNYYIDAELIMYKSGAIMINYDYIDPAMDDDGMTIGIQSSGTEGLQVAFNAPYVHDGLALSFTLPSHFIVDVDPFWGLIGAGMTEDVTMTYSSEGFDEGAYTEDLFITTNEFPANEWFIPNTMYVLEPAFISGMVTDCNTGAPLANVTVTAETVTKDLEDTFTADTEEDGTYMMYVNANTDYAMSAVKVGYQSDFDAVSVVMSAEVDFELCEMPYPVSRVVADPNEADTECLVTWTLPMGPYLIAYDDGTAEDYFAWVGAGGASAVKFTPAGYPARVRSGLIFVGDGSFPEGGNFLGTQMAVGVLDDDGAGGMPGTVLDSVVVTVNNYGWVDLHNAFNVAIPSGDFYLVMWQLGASPNVAPVGVDLDVPTVYRSYVKASGGEWMVSVYNDFMIRAIVKGPGENVMAAAPAQMIYPGKLSPDTYVAMGRPIAIPGVQGTAEIIPVIVDDAERDLDTYQLWRISDIDPDGGGNFPEDGTHLLIEPALTGQMFNDTDWEDLDPGFYAYAVVAVYDNGDESDMVYSNIAAHEMDNMVTLNISQCDGESPEGASVSLVSQNYPFQALTAVTDATGIIVFDSVINGIYDLTVMKEGYITYVHNNIYIFDDYEETIALQETMYPARNLFVEALTSVATWEIPYATLLDNEGFEDPTFPPAGWMIESEGGDGWFRTNNGGSFFFPIPAGDGFYACVNDDANDGNGCCDYLILPELDLSETPALLLQFDAYFDASFSQLASVEYSTDGGASWQVAFDLPAATDWTTYQVDFSMLEGESSVLIAIHSNDQGFWASGVAIDNVSAFYGKEPVGYYVYLDGGFVGSTAADVTTYTFLNLTYGVNYEAAVRALYSCGVSEPIFYNFTSSYLYPPRNLRDEYVYGTNEAPLFWNPPVTVAGPGPALPNVENDPVEGTTNHSLQAIPEGIAPTGESPSPVYLDITGNRENTAWIASPQGGVASILYTMDMGTYGTTTVGPSIVDPSSGDFMNGDETTMYMSGTWGADLYSVDVATGVGTMIAPVSGGFDDISGMACDRTSNTMYVSMTNITQSGIGTLDLATGVITPIGGPTGDIPGLIDIAIDGTGQMYGWCLVTDASYMIDKETGAVTSLGSLGFDANFGQGGNYNADDGLVYLTAFNNTAFAGELRVLDVVSGGTTFLTTLPELQMTAFGVPSAGGGGGGGAIPDGLISFNVYNDGAFIANVPYDGEGSEDWVPYVENDLMPECYDYEVTAVYDLTDYGFPGMTAESDFEGPHEVCVVWGIDLPFCEDFTQGTFEFNGWVPEGDNWVINSQVGNDMPSAQFNWDPDPGADYSVSLTSSPFNADMISEGDIWLDFEVALDDRNGTGDEMMKVEVYNGSNWTTLATFDNAGGSFDFTFSHIKITDYAKGGVFMVRFNAMGANSFDVIAWNVDNVCLYRTCAAPYDLTGEYVWNEEDDFGAEICWEADVPTAGGTEELIYDNGVTTGAYSYEGFVMATHMSPAGPCQVLELKYFTTIQAGDNSFNAVVFGWDGSQPGTTELYNSSQTAVDEDWLVVDVSGDALMFDGDFTVGFGSLNATTFLGFDAGLNNGRSWDYDNAGTWASWTEAYVIRALVEYPDGRVEEIGVGISDDNITISPDFSLASHSRDYSEVQTVEPQDNRANRALSSFNVYRMADTETEYSLLTNVAAEAGVSEYCYFDMVSAYPVTYCYKVTAVYEGETDYCESDAAAAYANPTEDFVCVLITDVENPLEASTVLYPNPASDFVRIASGAEITQITVINYVGQLVYDSEIEGVQSTTLNTGSYEAGVYVVKINTTGGLVTKRMIISR